jgi:hypothetical protein|tara:strand:- start:232 stop:333 length:102 start_codon:yes stop_codon:yes gene_type:complete
MTNILLGLILIVLCSIAFMLFVMGRMMDERSKK